jgi:quinol monooxygenase YgiN
MIRHTVIFTFYETTTREQIDEVIKRLNEMGAWLQENLGVTSWSVAEHIPETFKKGRAHLLQDGIFSDLEAMAAHAESEVHKRVVELTPKVCDWMTVDTIIS